MTNQANLGGVSFGLATSAIAEIQRTLELKWANFERVQNRPKKQFTGVGEETITLSCEYFPDVHGQNVVPRLREVALKGEPVTLSLGTGQNLRMWCIERIDSTGSRVIEGGVARKIAFTVTLTFFS